MAHMGPGATKAANSSTAIRELQDGITVGEIQGTQYEGFKKLGALFRSVYGKDHSILGSILGPCLWKPTYSPQSYTPLPKVRPK